MFRQAIHSSPNLLINIIFSDTHWHNLGYTRHGHSCNNDISNICFIYDKLWPIIDILEAMNTNKQNAYWEIERNKDNL